MREKRSHTLSKGSQAKRSSTSDAYSSKSQMFGKKPRALLDAPHNSRRLLDSHETSRGLLERPDQTSSLLDSMETPGGLLDHQNSSRGLLDWPEDPIFNQPGSSRGLLDPPDNSRSLLATPSLFPVSSDRHDRSQTAYSESSRNNFSGSREMSDYYEQNEDNYYQNEDDLYLYGEQEATYESQQLDQKSRRRQEMKTSAGSVKSQWELQETGESYGDLATRAQEFIQKKKISLPSSTSGRAWDGTGSNNRRGKSSNHGPIKPLLSPDSGFQSQPVSREFSSHQTSRSMSISPGNEGTNKNSSILSTYLFQGFILDTKL